MPPVGAFELLSKSVKIKGMDMLPIDRQAYQRTLVGALEEMRATLARAPRGEGPQTLLGQLTFADIAMAQVIAKVAPPPSGLKLGRATARTFVDPELRVRLVDGPSPQPIIVTPPTTRIARSQPGKFLR